MRALAIIPIVCLFSQGLCAVQETDETENWFRTRLLLGEIQYNALLGNYFDALAQIDDFRGANRSRMDVAVEKHQATSAGHFMQAGEIELAYRMSQRAGDAIRAVLGDDIDQSSRNNAAYALAKIYYDKQQYEYANYALQLIRGELFYPFKQDVEYLQALTAARQGEYDKAAEMFQRLKHDERFRGFATFNLGYVLLQLGKSDEALAQFTEVANLKSQDRSILALRDKANLILGYRALEQGDAALARQNLSNVRLEGAFSNKALLGAGWACMATQDYTAALTPWSELVSRESTDASVQEAYLGLPYAYGKLGLYKEAVDRYETAIAEYESSIARVNASLGSMTDGNFLQLLRTNNDRADSNWLLRLRELPETPETYYLMELLASAVFQESMHNYIDMTDMQHRLDEWSDRLVSLQDMIQVREKHYAGMMKTIDESMSSLDTRLADVRSREDELAQTIAGISSVNAWQYLVNENEQALLTRLDLADEAIGYLAADDVATYRQRTMRARGIIDWNLMYEYPARLDRLSSAKQSIADNLDTLVQRRDALSSLLKVAHRNYSGYEVPLQLLKEKVHAISERLEKTQREQSAFIQTLATGELQRRLGLLQGYLGVARYELAKNYDLAAAVERNR